MQKPAVLGTSALMVALYAAQAIAAPQTRINSHSNAVPQTNSVRAAAAPAQLQALPARPHITGAVMTRDEPPAPVKGATVRVRDEAGRIVGTAHTDPAGQFTFELERPGSYFVEAVDSSGKVLAVEDVGQVAVTAGPGQTATVMLRVPALLSAGSRVPLAAIILGAASAAGIAAFTAGGQPASPEK